MIELIKLWFKSERIVETVVFRYHSTVNTHTYEDSTLLHTSKDHYNHSVACITYDDGSRVIKFYGQSKYRDEHPVTASAKIWRDTGTKFAVKGCKGWNKEE